jgi:hypothetical protein
MWNDPIRRWAIIYFIGFLFVVAVGYVPGFEDSEGRLFGLFTLDLYDDSLHFASGLWGLIAGLHSRRWSELYFRIFGPLYFLDGVLGLITGSGYLDGGIFLYGPYDLPLITRFFANLPHFVIGGTAAWVGYRLARRTPPIAA